MGAFLCFRLHGPLASWGEIAVGEKRPSAPHPSRSAILGLVGAALGTRREDADAWNILDGGLGFASRTDCAGEILSDYHTAQGPEEKLIRSVAKAAKREGRPWTRPFTRRAELSFPRQELSTVLSSRQYRCDAVWTAAIWLRPEGKHPWTLLDLVEALRRPFFVPYLGRKSCPLDVPLEPQVVDAEHPVEAMTRAVFKTDALLEPVLDRRASQVTVRWEGSWPGLNPAQTVSRRDRVLSRSRWQFQERDEHQALSSVVSIAHSQGDANGGTETEGALSTRGGENVPEQG